MIFKNKMDLTKFIGYYSDSTGKEGFYTRDEMKELNLAPDSFFCHSLHYSRGVFEGIRAVWDAQSEELFYVVLEQHLRRLKRGSTSTLLMDVDTKHLHEVIDELVRKNIESGFINPKEGCYIRPLVYKDKQFDQEEKQVHGLGVYSQDHQTVLTISLFPWGAYLEQPPRIRVHESGVACCLRKYKTTSNYGFGGFAKDLAKLNGFDEALITDPSPERNVLEGGGENVFLITNGLVVTPSTAQDILPGTKRAILLEMFRNYGIEVEERKIPLDEFLKGDAALFTGTAAGVIPIKSVDDPLTGRKKEFDLGHRLRSPGLDLKHLEQQYQRMIHGEPVDVVHQDLQRKIRTLVPL